MQNYRQPTTAELERLSDALTTLTLTDARNQPAPRDTRRHRNVLSALLVGLIELSIIIAAVALFAQLAGK